MSGHDWAPEKRSFGDKLRDLWHEGMVRHVIVAKGERRVVDLPLAIIVIATLLAPWLIAIGAAIALLTEHHIRLERRDGDEVQPPAGTGQAPGAPGSQPQGAPADTAGPEALTGEASADLPAPPPPPAPPA